MYDNDTSWRDTVTFRIKHVGEERLPEDLERLPALASEYYKDDHEQLAWTDTLRTILLGVWDEHSTLDNLQGHEQTLVRKVYSYLAHEYAKNVKLTLPAAYVGRYRNDDMVRYTTPRPYSEYDYLPDGMPTKSSYPKDFVSFATCGDISDKFPQPNQHNVNMLPFIYGNESSLPVDLRCYQPCIDACPISETEVGKVCYLTVHESYVDPHQAQRREGLHIEAPGTILEENVPAFTPGHEHHWGGGEFEDTDIYEGGIYMASSVANTSRVYDAIVDNSIPGIADRHGGCEHLRGIIGAGTNLKSGQLIWMTDRTPHEALVQETEGMRQFFRVVTSNVSHWFAEHSTPNPRVGLPGNVVIVDENKFET